MAKHAGKDMLLKMVVAGDPVTYLTIAGQKTTGLTINGASIDVSDKDSGDWKTLVEGGLKSMACNAAGFADDGAAFKPMLSRVGQIHDYQLDLLNGITFTGPFLVSSLEITGELEGAQEYTISMESAGQIVTVVPA